MDPARDPDLAWLATLKVLYVEDDPTTRELLGRFLRRRVGQLVTAPDGLEGLERFRSERPALVLTDVQMPHLDGLAMAAGIRELDAHVPIIVTTAFEQVDYLRRSIEVSVDGYVTKPTDTNVLERALLATARKLRGEALITRERQLELERLRTHELEALAMFAGGMAHDFNNLLQVTLAAVEVVRGDVPAGGEASELLDAALAAVRQARDLGRSLLTLSEARFARLQAGSVLPTLRSALERGLRGSRTVSRVELPEELPDVAHDPELLGQAFEQLTVNAREAMRDGGVLTVSGSLHRSVDGVPSAPGASPYVELVFRDVGPGIRAEDLPRIFDPYFSTKERGQERGVGLGLSLCLAILRQHRGLVSATSAPGEGATFTVLLPAVATS